MIKRLHGFLRGMRGCLAKYGNVDRNKSSVPASAHPHGNVSEASLRSNCSAWNETGKNEVGVRIFPHVGF
jgi:hypothetical protein